MVSPSPADRLRAQAEDRGRSPAGLMVDLMAGPLGVPDRPGSRHTLLAVCPNSETVARAALEAASAAGAPLLLAATLNQVDRDGGYTGWTPADLRAFVDAERRRLDTDVPVVLGLDHGGPWKKDLHREQELSGDAAMEAVKSSVTACIEAGYGLLHLDPTTDPRLPSGRPVPVDSLVERTVELIAHAEQVRRTRGRGPIAYEVGTEEAGHSEESEARFKGFLARLAQALDRHSLPTPTFAVGDLGTRLGTSTFDPDRARRLAEEARRQVGALLKGHYTDEVADLSAYPLSGVGGANVGPGLAAVEHDALTDLAGLERRLGRDSGLGAAVRSAVARSGRWRKWLSPDANASSFDALDDETRDWLVATGSRYVWTHPTVESARESLYENVAPYRDASAFVHWRVRTDILRYMHAFNLVGFAQRLADAAETR